MPAHVKTMLNGVSLHVPVQDGRLALGTWQGIYLVEHRARPHRREVLLQFIGSRPPALTLCRSVLESLESERFSSGGRYRIDDRSRARRNMPAYRGNAAWRAEAGLLSGRGVGS